MEIYVLKNRFGFVEGVIVSKGSTKDEIEEAVEKVKSRRCFDSFDADLFDEELPKDCEVWWIDYNNEIDW